MLKVEDLTVKYGDAQVLLKVSFEAPEGCITCVLGPNGAGKTTLLRSITGLVSPFSGRILFGEREIQGKKTHDIARLGLIMIPEGRRLWAPLSVRENLEVGAYLLRRPGKGETTDVLCVRAVPAPGVTQESIVRNSVRRRTADGGHWKRINGGS